MNTYIKFKGIIISLLFGIIFLQGIWIYNAINERKAHFKTHIESAVNHAIDRYCSFKNNNKPNDSIFQKMVYDELLFLKEKPKFKLKISDNDRGINYHSNDLIYTLKCPNSKSPYYIRISLLEENKYILGSLISWIALSVIFIILLSLFTSIFLRNINVQGQIQKMKDEFTSNMTHELKTPISTISVASEILQNDKVNHDLEKVKRYSSIIYEENNRLKRLVDRVMQVALFESGNLHINLMNEDINAIISDITKPLQIVIAKHNGSLNLDLDYNNPILAIDKTHFSNIISNIVENAIKYNNSNPEITIKTKLNTNSFTIEIKDNGIGIEKDKIKHIFKKYYRINEKNTEQKTGFGLGLFYVYQIVKAHKADIEVDSKLNIGTTFKITFLTNISSI